MPFLHLFSDFGHFEMHFIVLLRVFFRISINFTYFFDGKQSSRSGWTGEKFFFACFDLFEKSITFEFWVKLHFQSAFH